VWSYRARVDRIIDGDTIDVVVDLGFRIEHTIRLRLAGVNTPEVRGEERQEGLIAKAFVEEWVESAVVQNELWPIRIETEKTGKYGRWIAVVYNTFNDCLNKALTDFGHNKTPGYGQGNWS
jgi:micrococcal nuclease